MKAALALLGLCDGTPRLPLLRAGARTLRCLSGLLATLAPLEEAQARRLATASARPANPLWAVPP